MYDRETRTLRLIAKRAPKDAPFTRARRSRPCVADFAARLLRVLGDADLALADNYEGQGALVFLAHRETETIPIRNSPFGVFFESEFFSKQAPAEHYEREHASGCVVLRSGSARVSVQSDSISIRNSTLKNLEEWRRVSRLWTIDGSNDRERVALQKTPHTSKLDWTRTRRYESLTTRTSQNERRVLGARQGAALALSRSLRRVLSRRRLSRERVTLSVSVSLSLAVSVSPLPVSREARGEREAHGFGNVKSTLEAPRLFFFFFFFFFSRERELFSPRAQAPAHRSRPTRPADPPASNASSSKRALCRRSRPTAKYFAVARFEEREREREREPGTLLLKGLVRSLRFGRSSVFCNGTLNGPIPTVPSTQRFLSTVARASLSRERVPRGLKGLLPVTDSDFVVRVF